MEKKGITFLLLVFILISSGSPVFGIGISLGGGSSTSSTNGRSSIDKNAQELTVTQGNSTDITKHCQGDSCEQKVVNQQLNSTTVKKDHIYGFTHSNNVDSYYNSGFQISY